MKTRIISGIVFGAIILGIIAAGLFVSPLFITALTIFLTVTATYELLKTALKIEVKTAIIGAMIASGLLVLLNDTNLYSLIYAKANVSKLNTFYVVVVNSISVGKSIIFLFYFLFAACVILAEHKKFDLGKAFGFIIAPRFLSYGFTRMAAIVRGYNSSGFKVGNRSRVYYLGLLVIFSCVCDMGAYFIGVKFGKHKLSPEISPKKTVEGAIGGIICAMITVIIFMAVIKRTDHALATVLLTVPLCILGMIGDLFASFIKRKADIKDYGNLIPGHGGILDRFDSILFIAPFLYMLISYRAI